MPYFFADFDFQTHAQEMAPLVAQLPPPAAAAAEGEAAPQATKWEDIFKENTGGYKPRSYVYEEFEPHFPSSSSSSPSPPPRFLEVGSGYGCTLFPLVQHFAAFSYTATDFSASALDALRANPLFDARRMATHCWDVTQPPFSDGLGQHEYDVVLSIFALSAVNPMHHVSALQHMAACMKHPTGRLLFRDYAIHDHTMFRHSERLAEHLFRRRDGTLCFYFSLEHLVEVGRAAGLDVVEQYYCCVASKNRKKEACMKRVFVHAVFQRRHDEPVPAGEP